MPLIESKDRTIQATGAENRAILSLRLDHKALYLLIASVAMISGCGGDGGGGDEGGGGTCSFTCTRTVGSLTETNFYNFTNVTELWCAEKKYSGGLGNCYVLYDNRGLSFTVDLYFQDADGDGYGDPVTGEVAQSGQTKYAGDCNDSDPTINPNATEVSDGVDNNCNGHIDEIYKTYYRDKDGDAYGNPQSSTDLFVPNPNGYVLDNTDCNDNSAEVHPNAIEIGDYLDNNCDGFIDEGFAFYCLDSDGDLYGVAGSCQYAATQQPGYAPGYSDCNNADPLVNPAATEVQDGIDNNCNGIVDETIAIINLNDTGIDWGGNYPLGNNIACTGESISQQDCSHGRDATDHDGGDGPAGFSYTKLDANGNDLPYSASDWSCVRDNITGLIWQAKQGGNFIVGDEGLHDADDVFSWYNTDSSTNGGTNGAENPSGNACHGYNTGTSASYCNTEKYVSRVNATTLCGLANWRLPSSLELYGLGNKNIKERFFDNSLFANTSQAWLDNHKSIYYWTSTRFAGDTSKSLIIDALSHTNFARDDASTAHVLLVHDAL